MALKAVGAYLRYLREDLDKTRVEVAIAAETNESQIVRIEEGKIDTRGSLLLGVARAVDASLEDVADLLLDKAATEETGLYRAQKLLAERKGIEHPQPPEDPNADIKAVVAELDNEQSVMLRRVLAALFPQFSLPRLPKQGLRSSRAKTSTFGA